MSYMAKKNDLTEDTEYNEFDDYEDDYFTDDETAAADTSYVTAEDEPREKFGGIRVLSVLFCLLAIGGLFIGLLSKWIAVFTPLALAGEGKLGASMLWLIIEGFKGLFGKASAANYGFDSGLFYPLVERVAKVVPYLTLAIALGVLVSLVCTIAALVSKKAVKARKLLYVNGYVVFFVYAVYFIAMFAVRLLCGYNSFKQVIDVPAAIIAGASLLILFIYALTEKKAVAALNFLLLLLVLGAGFGMFYKESETLNALRLSFTTANRGWALIMQIFALATAFMLLFNFAASALRLGARGKYLFVTVTYGLQFAFAVALAIVLALNPAGHNWSILGKLPMLVLLIASIAAFLVVLLFVILRAVKKKKANAEKEPKSEEAAAEAEGSREDGYAYPAAGGNGAAAVRADGQNEDGEYDDDYIDFDDYEEDDDFEYEYEPDFMPAPPMAYVAPPPPQPVVQPEPQPAPPPAPEPQPQPVPPPAPQPVVQQAPNIVILREKEKPAPTPPPAPQPVVQPEPQPAPLSEFEQKMAEYARQGVPRPAAEQQPPRVTERRPMPPPQPRKQPPQQPAAGENVYEDGQYTYDAFFHTLTPKQKSEFGDLFISNKYGTHNYLPVYVIGGDNKAFFSKVFIYLGRFRETISAGLLEKMYQYVNTKK